MISQSEAARPPTVASLSLSLEGKGGKRTKKKSDGRGERESERSVYDLLGFLDLLTAAGTEKASWELGQWQRPPSEANQSHGGPRRLRSRRPLDVQKSLGLVIHILDPS